MGLLGKGLSQSRYSPSQIPESRVKVLSKSQYQERTESSSECCYESKVWTSKVIDKCRKGAPVVRINS